MVTRMHWREALCATCSSEAEEATFFRGCHLHSNSNKGSIPEYFIISKDYKNPLRENFLVFPQILMVFKRGVLGFRERQWWELLGKLSAEQRPPFDRQSMSSEQRGSGDKPGALTGKHLLQRRYL